MSPKGKRSGFASLQDGEGGTVTITILPKMWSPTRPTVRTCSHEPGSTTHAVAYELDYLAIETSIQSARSLAYCVSTINEPGEAELLSATRASDWKGDWQSATEGSAFHDLVDLLNVANRMGVRLTTDQFSGVRELSVMRVLAQGQFLKTVEPLIFRARPRYTEQQDTLATPRGRLDDQSLLLSQTTGVPWLQCNFDEHTMDTPLLRVVKAALHVIASDRLPPHLSSLVPRADARAVQLARHLAQVQLLSRDAALLTAEHLWLQPLDRAWQPAVDDAIEVLRTVGPVPSSSDTVSDGFAMYVLTEKFWEQVVSAALTVAFGRVHTSADKRLAPGVTSPFPWSTTEGFKSSDKSKSTYPDFMFTTNGMTLVVDAKYKNRMSVSVDDGYQLFAYSHLSALNGRRSDLSALIFPGTPDRPARQVRSERAATYDYPLWAMRVPFPSRADVKSQTSWNDYLSRCGESIKALSPEWMFTHNTARETGHPEHGNTTDNTTLLPDPEHRTEARSP